MRIYIRMILINKLYCQFYTLIIKVFVKNAKVNQELRNVY